MLVSLFKAEVTPPRVSREQVGRPRSAGRFHRRGIADAKLMLLVPDKADSPRTSFKVTLAGQNLGDLNWEAGLRLRRLSSFGAECRIDSAKWRYGIIQILIRVCVDEERIESPKLRDGARPGIYAISAANQYYIGQSSHINKRLHQHWVELVLGTHHNRQLQSLADALDGQIGARVLELAQTGLSGLQLRRWLKEREQHWIERCRLRSLCLNVADAEVVLTEAASQEFWQENLETVKRVSAQRRRAARWRV